MWFGVGLGGGVCGLGSGVILCNFFTCYFYQRNFDLCQQLTSILFLLYNHLLDNKILLYHSFKPMSSVLIQIIIKLFHSKLLTTLFTYNWYYSKETKIVLMGYILHFKFKTHTHRQVKHLHPLNTIPHTPTTPNNPLSILLIPFSNILPLFSQYLVIFNTFYVVLFVFMHQIAAYFLALISCLFIQYFILFYQQQ